MTQLVGNHTESNVNNPSENSKSGAPDRCARFCVFDKERISYKTKVTETQSWNDIPTCKEEGLGRAVSDAARDVPARQGDAGAAGVLRRSVPEGDANARSARLAWKSRR